jgi:hypothetical protein
MSDITLVGDISPTVTVLTVDQDVQPAPGDKFLIDDEIIEFGVHPRVPAPWGIALGTVIAVERGVAGTVAASHSSGAVLTLVVPAYSTAYPPVGGPTSVTVPITTDGSGDFSDQRPFFGMLTAAVLDGGDLDPDALDVIIQDADRAVTFHEFGTGEIVSLYRAAILELANLVSYWRFGEASGTVAADEKGTNPGTYVGGLTLGVPGALPADPNTAVTLNGSTGNVLVADAASLDFANGPFTWIGWVKRTDAVSGTYQMMFSKGTAGNLYFHLNKIVFDNNTGDIVTSSVTITDTASWHMVALVRSGTGAGNTKVYWDGADVTVEGNTALALSTNSTALRFGTYTDDSLDLNGSLDEWCVIGRVLSPTEVLDIYNLGIDVPTVLADQYYQPADPFPVYGELSVTVSGGGPNRSGSVKFMVET